MERRAIVEHHGGAEREARHEPMPHHPSAGGEIKDPVLGLEVRVQRQFLQVLDERAAGAVDDALGLPGRARRVQDIQRVVEGQRRERRVGVLAQALRNPHTRTLRGSDGRPVSAALT